MKKQYNAPVAEMMEFDYVENVVASVGSKDTNDYVVPTELVDVQGDWGKGKGCGRCS